MSAERNRLRLYVEARTAHLERAEADDVHLAFLRASYDFDAELACQVGATKVGIWSATRLVTSPRYSGVEVNEPLMLSAWPLLLALIPAGWIRALRRGIRWDGFSAYAIENGDVPSWFASRLRLPAIVGRAAVRTIGSMLAANLRRIAFGSSEAADNYRAILRIPGRVQKQTFPALEPPCSCLGNATTPRDGVVFLGSFEERKGILRLLDAWAKLAESYSGSLTIIGKGPLLPAVMAAASEDQRIEVIHDPSRARIHAQLRAAKVVVLLSQPGERWREQLGLPIIEGLSHGCEIVTTTETGLAMWLRSHGHQVIDPSAPRDQTVYAIRAATVNDRSIEEIMSSLPFVSGRADADRWLRYSDMSNWKKS